MINMEDETPQINDQPNSVKISVNAKGKWSGEVKAYAADVGEAFEKAMAKTIELEKIIEEKNKDVIL